MKKQSQMIKRKSIKVKLLIVPLICVLVGVCDDRSDLILFNTSTVCFAEMRENGFSSSQRFVNRIEDNTEAVKTMNEHAGSPDSQCREYHHCQSGKSSMMAI